RDLIQLVNEGAFREDLYYRLNGITLYLPPLRERQDLRNIILKVLEAENDTGKKLQITPEAISHLLKYPWPGNLRQLRNVIRTAVALCDGDVIDVSHINLPTLVGRNQNHAHTCSTDSSASKPKKEDLPPVDAVSDNPLRSAEHTVILNALKTYNWNITRTAEALDMSRNTLYRKIQKHNIKQDN
ncbi:MAG: helix-turn-helix domain-containing protein, partial [Candidatus Thiodiazotropha endolucinida]